MGLVFNKSGNVTERTRWNLSFSGISLSHKRGRLTLNTRGRSNFRIAKGWNFRVHTGVAYVLWVLFFALDALLWLFGGLAFLVVAICEGFYYGLGYLFSSFSKEKEPTPAPTKTLLEEVTVANKETAVLTAFEPFNVDALTLESPIGVYDIRTSNGKIYEIEVKENKTGEVSLDQKFGEESADSSAPTLELVDLLVVKGSRAKFTVRKPNKMVSTMTTKHILEIVCVKTP